ncbi:MAG TPA: NAD(P)H-binding protein [Nitrospira sp.]|nr:NAD(P)H-binding protein [Nitrospira sp.]
MSVAAVARRVFLTGGTGYVGSRLIPLLLQRKHSVRAIVRPSSLDKLPDGCETVVGSVFDRASLRDSMAGCDTVVQLVGVPKPAPWKGPQFRAVDQVSALAAIGAANDAGIRHFIYVSVAHPAPIMKEYIAVRAVCEAALRATGLPATIVRPWYVLGPGHRWPLLLKPGYWVCERLHSTHDSARRLGLVTIYHMLATLLHAVDHPPDQVRVIEVPDIRAAGQGSR